MGTAKIDPATLTERLLHIEQLKANSCLPDERAQLCTQGNPSGNAHGKMF